MQLPQAPSHCWTARATICHFHPRQRWFRHWWSFLRWASRWARRLWTSWVRWTNSFCREFFVFVVFFSPPNGDVLKFAWNSRTQFHWMSAKIKERKMCFNFTEQNDYVQSFKASNMNGENLILISTTDFPPNLRVYNTFSLIKLKSCGFSHNLMVSRRLLPLISSAWGSRNFTPSCSSHVYGFGALWRHPFEKKDPS